MENNVEQYKFNIVIEPDEDTWFAYCPALLNLGGSTFGYTKEEARKNIQEVIEMIVEELIEEGKAIPSDQGSNHTGQEMVVNL